MKFRIVLLTAAVVVLAATGAWAGHGKCSHGPVLLNQSLMNIKQDCKMCAGKKHCDKADGKTCKKDDKMCKKDKKSCPIKKEKSCPMESQKSKDMEKSDGKSCCPMSH